MAMVRLKIPFQFKIYILILVLFAALLHLTTFRINSIISRQILTEEKDQFKGLKTVFYNLLNSKIEILVNEALLLAEQDNLRVILNGDPKKEQIHVTLNTATPRLNRWPLMLITDRYGKLVEGKLLTDQPGSPIVDELSKIEKYLPSEEMINTVLQGAKINSYLLINDWTPASLFALSTVPVRSTDDPQVVIGSVTLGFPIDQAFALDLRSGSRYHIGFVLQDHLITSTLDTTRERDLRFTWDSLSKERQQQLLTEPEVLSLYDERFLVFASPLPTVEGKQGYYIILNSLEESLGSLQELQLSVYWVSIIILCGTLIVGYILARGVTAPIRTLADAVTHIAEGDYSVRVNVRTGDELETLGHKVQLLAQTIQHREGEIKDYVKQIEEWNKELETKVAERTRDLEEKNIRLRMISEELGRAYEKIDDDLKTVGELQRRILPSTTYDRKGVSIRSFYLPNGRAGGDYYDFITPSPDRIFVLIADVSGHGTPAAFIMGITRAIAHTLIVRESSPGQVLGELGNILMKTVRAGEFVTMFLGCLDLSTQQFLYASAGHPSPLLYRKKQEKLLELNVNQGLPLGILEDTRYEELSTQVEPGDRLLLYTDGIVEAFNDHKIPYGLPRLQEVMNKNAELSPEDLLELIVHDLEAFVQRAFDIDPLEDDVTLVAIDFKEVPASVTAEK